MFAIVVQFPEYVPNIINGFRGVDGCVAVCCGGGDAFDVSDMATSSIAAEGGVGITARSGLLTVLLWLELGDVGCTGDLEALSCSIAAGIADL